MSVRNMLFCAVLSACALISCGEDNDSGPGHQSVPEPVRVANREFVDTDSTYFADATDLAQGEVQNKAGEKLQTILDRGIRIDAAWFPEQPTACASAPGAATIAIVQLLGPDTRLLGLGFMDSLPSFWIPNCGVDSLLEYRFR